MKSAVWTFVDRKPKVFLVDRYYLLKSEKDLSRLINKLLEIDAVTTPIEIESFTYPALVEVVDGFAPQLRFASYLEVQEQSNALNDLLTQHYNLTIKKNKSKPLRKKKARSKKDASR